jgi:hypothetical protein
MNMKMKSWFLGFAIAGAFFLGSDARATDLFEACMQGVKRECQSWAAKGGGGEAPRGLTRDTRVELADGEKYILSGFIEVSGGEVYLAIDFRAQPWLANKARLRDPFYQIEDSADQWRKYAGREVTLIAVARYDSWRQGGKLIQLISLIPEGEEPVIPALQKRPRR